MQHPDEGTIHAWIDGELSQEEAAVLEAHLKECAECSALAAEARGLVAASSRIVRALDIVPGDVIPKARSNTRAWYMSTQVRAAAAVMIVAGASLLVFRSGDQARMRRAMESAATAVAVDTAAQAKEPDRVTPVASAAPMRVAETPQAKANPPRSLEKKKSIPAPRGEAAKVFEGRVAGVAANEAMADAAKAVQPMQPMQPIQSRDTAAQRRFSANRLDEVVITGVAVATGARELKKVRTDSANNETVYEVRPGLEVTLVDNGQASRIMLRGATQSSASVPAAAPLPPPSAQAVDVVTGIGATKAAAIDSISWTSKRGHAMKLRGPLSKQELENVRQRLPEDQR